MKRRCCVCHEETEFTMHVCPGCFGNLRGGRETVRAPRCCPVCHGSGLVPAALYIGESITGSVGKMPCRSCGGTGVIWG